MSTYQRAGDDAPFTPPLERSEPPHALVGQMATADLAVIVVSHNSQQWLEPCLRTLLERRGDIELDVVVVDNASTDGSPGFVEERFPEVRVLRGPNHGFAAGNNLGLLAVDAPFVLLLNPDTEIAAGTLADIVAALRARPEVGLVGVRQVTADGTLWPTIRRLPTVTRELCQALGSERWPVRRPWMGERELDLSVYDDEVDCDWTSGSFMLVRREALLAAGLMDERFFLYSEETDLCARICDAGWCVRHLPMLTIVHHAGKDGVHPRMVAQSAFARRQYAEKHFTPARARLYLAALRVGHRLRAYGPASPERKAGARLALRTLAGRTPPPFGPPPPAAVSATAVPDRHLVA